MEMLVIAAVALVVVGPEKLPEAVRGVARFYHGLRKAFMEAQSTVKSEMALLERELQQTSLTEPGKNGAARPAPAVPQEDQADERA
jgi:Tat protein translocase TatB subunit